MRPVAYIDCREVRDWNNVGLICVRALLLKFLINQFIHSGRISLIDVANSVWRLVMPKKSPLSMYLIEFCAKDLNGGQR